MMRGPVLPQSREALWSLVVGRLETIERGLTLQFEGFDCSDGQFGLVDGLARDAAGAPVLVLLATEGDALLIARAFAAADFLHRVGESLASAIPEAAFCPGAAGRVLVIAVERCAAVCDVLMRQAIAGVQVCRLEPFRVAGSERFAVRWLASPVGERAEAAVAQAFVVPAEVQPLWTQLHDLCLRIDAGVKIDGDRYRRRITWNGQPLAEVMLVAGVLHGSCGGASVVLGAAADVRSFFDGILRAYARAAGLSILRPTDTADAAPERDAATRRAANGSGPMRGVGDSLRAVAASARLTPEEYSALGGPTSAVGGEVDGAVADDVARLVSAREENWPLPGRPD